MQNGVSQTPQAVLECRDPLDHLWRGRLRLDIGIERDFALDLLNGFGNRGFAVVYRVDDLRNDAGKRIGVGHDRSILQGSPEPECNWPRISRQSFLGFGSWLNSPERGALSLLAIRVPVRAPALACPSLQIEEPSGPPWRWRRRRRQFRRHLLARLLHRLARRCRGSCDA